ncbi:hypothetical protein TREES_T100002733 [Tupaia chinensis]|uniref:Maturin n=1 Tax=Tupaia chinensis TaxID=246437 RepID=L9KYA2_TUPCH|nr:hypothetical protein TREES_T100002733 [Tupaia chinensis]
MAPVAGAATSNGFGYTVSRFGKRRTLAAGAQQLPRLLFRRNVRRVAIGPGSCSALFLSSSIPPGLAPLSVCSPEPRVYRNRDSMKDVAPKRPIGTVTHILPAAPMWLLGLPDADDDAFEEYSADVEEEEPEADHPQMGVSQQ